MRSLKTRQPTVLKEARQVAATAGVDSILGLGGGSSMDTAKGANFLLTNGGRMQDYWGVGKADKEMLPLIVIPTTAGTGSECQSFALISDAETHQKMACGDPKAAAKIAILDSELTLSQPRNVTACTGIDAIAHAVETAVTNKKNELSRMFSKEAFGLLMPNFATVLRSPDDLNAWQHAARSGDGRVRDRGKHAWRRPFNGQSVDGISALSTVRRSG